ncbi:MAG: efflux RND transporter periplasmic adaptor subunit [Gemmatimonadetes bacterium]|nr:efflux RND transporter periplasmic adaptor subunit [Gemmatimonadota bacterium]
MKHLATATLARSTILALLVAGCADEVEIPVYRLVPVETRDIVLSAEAAGTIEPVTTIEVKSKASGEIIEIAVETGDRVVRGDLLVRVDQRVARNALTQAEADLEVSEAQLDNARAQFERSEALHATEYISDEEYETARLTVANARASLVRSQRGLEDARISFEDTEVRAPAAGIVLSRSVEVGSVIQSASQNVSGGSVLLRMADLDTVQVRTLVDETDIGKLSAGLPVTITVDAYPGRDFTGSVLKIEPEALEQQNVVMFPVLVRIGNEEGLLRSGMSCEVEIHLGSREGVVAVPNAALRTDTDVGSASQVLGLDMDTVREQLAAGSASRPRVSGAGRPAGGETITFRDREITLPAGLTVAEVQPVLDKLQSGGFQSLTDEDRAVMARLREASGFGGQRPGGQPPGREGGQRPEGAPPGEADNDADPEPVRRAAIADLSGRYIVFVMRDGVPTAVRIRTGLTDMDYSEVLSGLVASDSVLVLPSAALVQSQQELQERIQQRTGGAMPGVSGGGGRPPGR